MPLLTRIYSPSDFAPFNLFKEVLAGIGILMTFRIEYLVMVASSREEAVHLLGSVMRMAAWATVVFTVPAVFLVPAIEIPPPFDIVANWIWLAPITAMALAVSVGMQQFIQRSGDFRASGGSEVAGRMSYVAIALVGSAALPSIIGLMSSILVGAIGKIFWLLRTGIEFPFNSVLQAGVAFSKRIRRLGLSLSVSGLISIASSAVPMIFIAERYGADALGQYGLVISTMYLPSALLGQAIGQVYYQRASIARANGDSFSPLFVATSANLLKVGLPVFAAVAIVSPLAYPLVFGEAWESAGEVARWMALAALAGFVSTPLDRTSLVADVWWYPSAWNAVRAMLVVACVAFARAQELGFMAFIASLSCLLALLYVADWVSGWFMSRRVGR